MLRAHVWLVELLDVMDEKRITREVSRNIPLQLLIMPISQLLFLTSSYAEEMKQVAREGKRRQGVGSVWSAFCVLRKKISFSFLIQIYYVLSTVSIENP